MADEMKQDVASAKDLKAALDDALKHGQTIIRLEMSNDASLALLERMLQETIVSRMHANALVSVTPQFDAWVLSGLWPIYPQGWTVLLRRQAIQGQVRPEVAQAAQQSKLIKS